MGKLNIPKISVGRLAEERAEYYSRAILSGKELRKIPAALLSGLPGIGKSDCFEQIAEGIEEKTGRHVEIREIRLSNCTLTDIIGIPSADKEKENTVWLPPCFFKEPEDPDTIILNAYDEIDKAAPSVQAAALQLILDKKSFVHKLPKNTIVIAAGNPDKLDNILRSKLRAELNNRFCHFHVVPEFRSWKAWAEKNAINPYVLEYLAHHSDKLYDETGASEDTAFPTPRTWAFVSDYLDIMLEGCEHIDELHHGISGYIGLAAAMEFEAWFKMHDKVPSAEEIFYGSSNRHPKSQDALFSLIDSMVSYLEENDLDVVYLENGCAYANRFPADYTALFYEQIQAIPGMKHKLLMVRAFREWREKHK